MYVLIEVIEMMFVVKSIVEYLPIDVVVVVVLKTVSMKLLLLVNTIDLYLYY